MSRFIPCKTKNLYAHEQFGSRIFLYRDQEGEGAREACSLGTLAGEGRFCLLFCGTDSDEERVEGFLPGLLKHPGSSISFEKDKNLQTMKLARLDAGSFRTENTVDLAIKNYGLELDGGGTVRVCTEASGREYLQLEGGYGFYRLVGFFYAGQGLRLEMEEMAGCFSFSLEGLTTLQRLGVFLCFTKEDKTLCKAKVQPLSPVFGPFSLSVSLDVLHPEDKKRTFFTLPAGNYDTSFPIALGKNLELALEKEGDAFLLFSRERKYQNNASFAYHLVPEGSFTVRNGGGDLLPGGNGLEYVRFRQGSTVSFHGGKGAHFAAGESGPGDSGQTAYLAMEGTYYAQGQESAFFVQDTGMEYDFLEIPFCSLDGKQPLPMLPLGRTGEKFAQEYPGNLAKLDGDCLQPFRGHALLQEKNHVQEAGEAQSAINEKGTVLSYVPGSDSLACLELGDKFRFRNVSGSLKKALLCAKPFVVVTDVEEFLEEAQFVDEDPPLEIGGWKFDFAPSGWSKDTVLVVKYAADRSLAEYAQESSEWSYPVKKEDRKKAAKVLGDRLKSISRESAPLFFDPGWCGAVLLEMPVASGGLPSEIRFLARVGKPPCLTLQYMAFDRRTASEEGITPSKVSGIIHYENQDYGAPDRQYDFFYRLNLFHASFENSQEKDFYCELSVALFYLFGAPLTARDSHTGNFIPIKGWRNAETDTADMARISFALKEVRDYRFLGSAIDRMEINGAKLLASKDGNRVNFFFSGGMGFQNYESDLFSFGEEKEASQEERSCLLQFLDLEVDVEGEQYAGSSDNMKFLTEESTVRRHSLGESFALEVKKLALYQDLLPQQLGYEGIAADGIVQGQLEEAWTGLELDVNLGGMGALAEAADIKLHFLLAWSQGDTEKSYSGGINVELPKLYVGVRLGDLSGTTEALPIQGVMSLGVEAVELKREKNGKEDGAFYFLLKDFVLKFFGLQFPYGSNRLYVFGNGEAAEGSESQKKLAFYGAYERKR